MLTIVVALIILVVLVIGSVVLLDEKNEMNNVQDVEDGLQQTNQITTLDGLFKSESFNENYARLVDSIVWDSESEIENRLSTEIVCQNKGELSINTENDNIICICKNGYKKLEKLRISGIFCLKINNFVPIV